MLFVISVSVLVIGIILIVIYNHYNSYNSALEACSVILTVIGIFALVACVIAFSMNYFGVGGYVAENQQRYDSLTYQYENDIYDNDNDLGKKELFNQIQEWNEDLAWYKENQKDFWIGIFIPNIYDQFEFIKLSTNT